MTIENALFVLGISICLIMTATVIAKVIIWFLKNIKC